MGPPNLPPPLYPVALGALGSLGDAWLPTIPNHPNHHTHTTGRDTAVSANTTPDDDGPKVLLLPTRKTLHWLNREMRKLMDQVPWQYWPGDEPEATYDGQMDAEEELRKTVQRVKDRQAQQQAEAAQKERLARQTTPEAVMIEEFVRTTLPAVVDELLPKVSKTYGGPVATASGAPANQFDGDHHDWHYAFSVGKAEAVVDTCARRIEVYINRKPYRVSAPFDRDAAIKLVNVVVEQGL